MLFAPRGLRRLIAGKRVLLGLAALILAAGVSRGAQAVVIQTGSELYLGSGGQIGDFSAVGGALNASSPGQVLELLGGSLGGAADLHANGSESGTNTVSMGSLWSTLNSGGVTSASRLVFGFGVNETGPIGSNWASMTDLTMSFARVGGGTDTFTLGAPDFIQVYNIEQGTNSAEALIEVNLGFDFMAEYNAASSESFTVSANVDNTSDGFEIFFLSSAYTADPIGVPEPASVVLALLAALGGAVLLRRRG